MIVDKEGSLELYALHDTPKQAIWSSRGELAIGAGSQIYTIEGYTPKPGEEDPWNGNVSAEDGSPIADEKERDHSGLRDGSVVRDHHTPLFGRGDKEGFPALRTPSPSRLSVLFPRTVEERTGRTFSPSGRAMRKVEGGKLRSVSMEVFHRREDSVDRDRHGRRRGRSRERERERKEKRSVSKNRTKNRAYVGKMVEEDVSMCMRRRLVSGYGVGDVSFCRMRFLWFTRLTSQH